MTRWGVEIPSTGYGYWMLQALAIENGQKLMNERRQRGLPHRAEDGRRAATTGSTCRARTA